MKYRRFGKLDWEVSVLGFGVIRLPLIDEDPTNLNEAESSYLIVVKHGKQNEVIGRGEVKFDNTNYRERRMQNDKVKFGEIFQKGCCDNRNTAS